MDTLLDTPEFQSEKRSMPGVVWIKDSSGKERPVSLWSITLDNSEINNGFQTGGWSTSDRYFHGNDPQYKPDYDGFVIESAAWHDDDEPLTEDEIEQLFYLGGSDALEFESTLNRLICEYYEE
jgi:hypothetical protein